MGTLRLDLAGLSLVLLVVGGGFGPPLLGPAVAVAAGLPEPRHRRRGSLLASAFPWLFGAAVVAWLALVPGLPLLDLPLGVGGGALLPPAADHERGRHVVPAHGLGGAGTP